MVTSKWLSGICILLLSVSLLVLAKQDFGISGILFSFVCFTVLISIELNRIRVTLIDIYADAITNHRILLWLIRGRAVNLFISIIISLFLSADLLLYIVMSNHSFILMALFLGGTVLLSYEYFQRRASHFVKNRPALIFGRVALIYFSVALFVVIDASIDLAYPIDPRITVEFDQAIPDFVNSDINHSFTYFQHILRTLYFLELNFQSISFLDLDNNWFYLLRGWHSLNPAPYIAFTFIIFSIMPLIKRKGDPQ